MRAYIIRRLLLVIPTVFLVSLVIFLVIRLIPGDVVNLIIKEVALLTPADVYRVRQELGLDVPVHIQFVRWMGNLFLRGDLGTSLWTRTPVTDQIFAKLPVTIELGLMGLIIAQLFALPIGVYSALRQDTWGDYIGRSFATLCIAVPGFWLGTMIIVFPSIWWGYMPAIIYIPFTEDPIGNLKMFIVPALLMGMLMSGQTMRMTRSMMLEVMRQDYIRTAWAKGLRERVVILRHTLKNVLIPVITLIGGSVPVLIGGSVIIEQIFCLPGLGRLTVGSITYRDYTVVSGILLFYAAMVVLSNLVTDLTYAYLDPRIRYR